MNSKDKPTKQSKPARIFSLMTPRNLVPATPMRFNSAEEVEKKPMPIAAVKGKKAAVSLPPGYVDRAAQRRQGLDSAINFEDFQTVKEPPNEGEDETKEKLEFLYERKGSNEFPTCMNKSTERLMNFILKGSDTKRLNELFRPNEAFLQFKSIEEAKTQPFDPYSRPKKVFRATRSKIPGFDDEEVVLERVKEALGRLKTSTERNQKYLEALACASANNETEIHVDIFPEAGRFDERAALENFMKIKESESAAANSKSKAKNRLFKQPQQQQQQKESEMEIDVFDMIAQKSLDAAPENDKKDVDTSGGLFGFTEFLPKLSRLESKDAKTKLSGAYASILEGEGEETEGSGMAKREKATEEDEDDYLYPGYLENDPMAFDSDGEAEDEEPVNPSNGKGQKRKMARREDKEAAKVEKLVKSKFGVDLTK